MVTVYSGNEAIHFCLIKKTSYNVYLIADVQVIHHWLEESGIYEKYFEVSNL